MYKCHYCRQTNSLKMMNCTLLWQFSLETFGAHPAWAEVAPVKWASKTKTSLEGIQSFRQGTTVPADCYLNKRRGYNIASVADMTWPNRNTACRVWRGTSTLTLTLVQRDCHCDPLPPQSVGFSVAHVPPLYWISWKLAE